MIYWPRESVDSDLVESPAPVQSSERGDDQNVKVDAFKDQVRQQVMQAQPAAPVSREPNTYFDPDNYDPVHRKNYDRHRQIVDFVTSPYRFYLSRRYSGKVNITFVNGHIEALTLRELTLPVESVQRRWFLDGKAHLEHLPRQDADNWEPFIGLDEPLPDG